MSATVIAIGYLFLLFMFGWAGRSIETKLDRIERKLDALQKLQK